MQKPPAPLHTMLGQVLGCVAQTTGSGAPLTPIWESVVGPLTARHARAISLLHGVLLVRADAPGWRDELLRHEPELVGKLAAALGTGVIRVFKVEVG